MSKENVIVEFTDVDVLRCAPDLSLSEAGFALEQLGELFRSYLYESGMEILGQLLRERGFAKDLDLMGGSYGG